MRRDSSLVNALSYTTTVIQSITANLQQTNGMGGVTAIASISDEHFARFLERVEDLLRRVNASPVLSFPVSTLFGALPAFIAALPFHSRPSLLGPICPIMTQLMTMDGIPESTCYSFLITQLSLLSSLPTPTAIRNARILSGFGFHFILHKPDQFIPLLHASTSLFDETPSKKPRGDSLLSAEMHPVLFLFLLFLYNAVVIGLNHASSFSAEFVDAFARFQLELVQWFGNGVVPAQRLGEATQAIRDEDVMLCVCVEVCLTQLLEKEEELKRRLARYVELSLKGEEATGAVRQTDCVVMFDGESGGVRGV